MAKFHNYYVLCPLIDQKSFMGVTKDKEPDTIVITLARNIIHKYRLTDQKQIGGWTSKDHITSAVIYDKEEDEYIGVFNNNTIKKWKEDCNNLDKVKKYKFPLNILRLKERGRKPSLVIFSNGNCATTWYAIENKDNFQGNPVFKDNEEVLDCATYTISKDSHICYVVKNSKCSYRIIHGPLRESIGDLDKYKINSVEVKRPEDVYVVGTLICFAETVAVYILWSDGKMTTYDLIDQLWKTVGTVPWISTTSSVSMALMGKNHIILFGSNTDQDGALLVVYNYALGVGTTKYPMKMYSEDAAIYCFDNRIILEATNHIGMLPYILDDKRNLSNILGSHEIQNERTEIADWDTSTKVPFTCDKDIMEYLQFGLTERNICVQVIPPLLEHVNPKQVLKKLKHFKDIPESVLVMLLKYVIKFLNASDVDVTDNDDFLKFCTFDEQNEQTPKSKCKKAKIGLKYHQSRLELLNYIFKLSFSDALLIPYLKNSLTLDDTLFLMRYICYLLMDANIHINTEYESKLYDWCILLMDTFYLQYVMSKEEKVAFVLENMNKVVVNLIEQLNIVDSTLPLIVKLINGKTTDTNEETLLYSIEMLEI